MLDNSVRSLTFREGSGLGHHEQRHMSEASTVFSSEINRLISAAVINPGFCRLLLNSPTTALAMGYNGRHFDLTEEELSDIVSIRASSLQQFVMMLLSQRKPYSSLKVENTL